jgi:transposase
MRDWLVSEGVTVAAIESTSSYWKAPFYCLEEVVEVWLLNAQHMKAVPGRKTDVKDAEWIAQLLEHGLLRPSFVPSPPIRRAIHGRASSLLPVGLNPGAGQWTGCEPPARRA